MVHGLLDDKHKDFFIQRTPQVQDTDMNSTPAHSASEATQTLLPDQAAEDSNAAEWHQGFQVSMQALPPSISVSIAEDILFVGKAVRVLQQPTGASPALSSMQVFRRV